MVLTARSLEWTVVGTELESLTLEYTWIKEFDPRFNVVFRDDKTYPYLAISSGERIPRVWVTRSRKRRDTRYFGPYAKVWDLRHSLDALLKTFPVRTCSKSVFHKAQLTGRPCLLASIGKCSAPCVNRIGADEHRRMCEQLVGVMTGRIGKSYIAQLTRDMKQASAELEFEKAARLRDQIQMLGTVVQQNAVVFDSDVDADVFGIASDELEASVHAFFVRSGSIRGERNWSVERVEDVSDAELIADLITQVYSETTGESAAVSDSTVVTERRNAIGSTQTVTATDAIARAQATKERNERQEQTGRADLLAPIAPVPREVIVPIEPSRSAGLEQWLSGLRGAAVTIRVASRGDKKQLMDRANDNAKQALARSKMSRISDMGARSDAMNDVAKALGLEQAPLRIECYDISNTVGGAFQVASMVVFEDAIAKKSEYRRFAIRGADGQGALDDLSALYETLTRRFRHGNIAGDSGESMDNERRMATQNDRSDGTNGPETDAVQQNTNRRHFAYKPNLVVVDGGKPQVMAAAKRLPTAAWTMWPSADWRSVLRRFGCRMTTIRSSSSDNPKACICCSGCVTNRIVSPSPTIVRPDAKELCVPLWTTFPASAKPIRNGFSTISAPYAPCVRRAWRISNRSKASAMPRPRTFTRHCIRPLTLLRRRRMPSEQ